MSIIEKGKTKTAVSDAEVGEIKARATVILEIMHGHGASTSVLHAGMNAILCACRDSYKLLCCEIVQYNKS